MDRFMKRAFALASKADPFPNPKVGAVLVKGGKVIGEGYHHKAGMPHAEIEAMEDAERRSGKDAVSGATLYVTLEPCSHTKKRTPPCTKAIIRSGIRKVVYAMDDPNPLVRGAQALRAQGIGVTGPTDPDRAVSMNRRYARSVAGRPFIAIKMAMSADGKTATRTGDSRWIGCREERDFVGRLRSEYDAVMIGAQTAIVDSPRLTSRVRGGRDPLRIIVDGRLRLPSTAAILNRSDGKTIIATSERAPESRIALIARGSGAHVFVCGRKEVDLKALCEGLMQIGVKKLLIEGGSELNAKALEAGIVDRLYFFIAPKLIGGREAKGVIGGRGIAAMKDAVPLKNMKARKVGCDILLQYDIIR